MIKDVITTLKGGNPGSFRGNLILFISLNDVRVGKTHLPESVLAVCREVAALLRQFPQGTVSIVGPGSEDNWHYAPGSFSHLAEEILAPDWCKCVPVEVSEMR